MKKWALGLCAVAVWLPLVGCGEQATNSVNHTNATQGAASVQQSMNTTSRKLGVDTTHDMRVAQNTANRIVHSGLAKQASVLTVGDTAYIGVVQKAGTHGDLSNAAKTQIASVAKQQDSRIKTVYVSANPDVYTHFQTYAGDIQRGQPVSGFWNNFRSIVLRIWPTAK